MTYREGVLTDLVDCGYEYEQATEIYDIAFELADQVVSSPIFETPGFIFLIRNVTIIDSVQNITDYRLIMQKLIDTARTREMTMYAMQHEIIRNLHDAKCSGADIMEMI